MKDSDKRQLLKIRDCIASFESRQIGLGQAVQSIEGLENALVGVDVAWQEQFHNEWWTLEQVFAVALDRGDEPSSVKYDNLVREALANMKHLLAEFLCREDDV